MGPPFFLQLANFELFWKARAAIARGGFTSSRWAFSLLLQAEKEFADSRVIRGISRVIAPQLVLALGTALGAQAANPLLQRLYAGLGWNTPEDGIYGTLLAGVSSVGAILIGLYYAGISAVVSAVYARLPQAVRELLARDRIGNAYMRFLAFLTFFSLSMLCLRVLGYDRVAIVVPFVGILAGFGIFGFIRLGQRAFYLFDPVEVSDTIFVELRGLIDRVAAGGFRWGDASFQNNARERAAACVEAIKALYEFCSAEHHLSERPRVMLLARLVRVLIHYQGIKSSIPTESLWYERSYEHPAWYMTTDSTTMIADNTGTLPQPKTVADHRWIEDRLTALLLNALHDFIFTKRITEALQVISMTTSYLTALAQVGEVGNALDLVDRVAATALDALSAGDGSIARSEKGEGLGLVEAIASLPIDLCLQYRSLASKLFAPIDHADVKSLASGKRGTVYQESVPVTVRERFEFLAERLAFERAVEGVVVSPPWYVRELLAVVAAEVHSCCVRALNAQGTGLYRKWTRALRDANHVWLYAVILSREREYLNKLTHADAVFRQVWDGLTADRRISGLKWPDPAFDALSATRIELARSLIAESIGPLISLASLDRPRSFPDYFGQFLHAAGEEVMEALLAGDAERLRALFPFYFQGCLVTFDKLRGAVSGATEEDLWRIRVAAGAILDLIELSGYAKLMAAYHGDDALRAIVTESWGPYLDEAATPARVVVVAAILRLVELDFSIPMRGILRTNWNQRIARLLSDVPRREIHRRGGLGSTLTLILHSDPLVRVFADTHFGISTYNGQDVFVELYLKRRPDATGVVFPRRRDLDRSIERETRKYAEYEHS